MSSTPTVTTRDAALGAALLQARQQVPGRLPVRTVGAALGLNASSISRYEKGTRRPSPEVVVRLLDYYVGAGAPIDDKTRNELIALAQAPEASPWVALTLPEQRRQLDTLIKFERTADHIISVDPALIPGLCQTNETSRAIMTRAGVPEDDLEVRVAVRTGRRYQITRDADPVHYTALINEVVLRRRIGGPQVMAAQMRHLLNLAERPNVSIRILPDETDWHAALSGGFELIQFTDRTPVVFVETLGSGLFLDHQADVKRYVTAADLVLSEAMTETDSAEAIARALHNHERTHQ